MPKYKRKGYIKKPQNFWEFIECMMIIGDAVTFIGLIFGLMARLVPSALQYAGFMSFFSDTLIIWLSVFTFLIVVTVIDVIFR